MSPRQGVHNGIKDLGDVAGLVEAHWARWHRRPAELHGRIARPASPGGALRLS